MTMWSLGTIRTKKSILLSLECWCLEDYFLLNFKIACVQVLCLFQKEQNAKSLTRYSSSWYASTTFSETVFHQQPRGSKQKIRTAHSHAQELAEIESTIPVLPIPSGGGASTITSVSGPRPCWSLSTGKDSLGFSTSQKNGGFALQQISTALFQPRNKKADKKQPCGRKMMYRICLTFSWFMCDSLSYWRENRSQHRKIPRFSFCDSWYWGLFDYRDSSNDCGNECKAKVATLE